MGGAASTTTLWKPPVMEAVWWRGVWVAVQTVQSSQWCVYVCMYVCMCVYVCMYVCVCVCLLNEFVNVTVCECV